MKKGFFLLEALLACTLLSVLVGAIIHHYGQWSRSYKKAVQQGKAVSIMMTLIEQQIDKSPESECYSVSKKIIPIAHPGGSLALISGVELPSPSCIEVIVSWNDDATGTHTVSAITGG